ncbi:MAG TPA: hypothetical protein VM577_15415 [Anaerovoracaceae bacterium]|nr:hypothetical protein [Anaerovoracaceae bacterium]
MVLNFSERTLPAKDGSWIDRTLRNSSKPKVNVASNDPYVSRVYLSLYQEALRNGLNPELAKAAKKQEEEEEYEHMKVSHAVHYSFAKEDGSVVKLDGYCNDDKESKGTYMNGVQICGVSTIFGREFIQNNLKL